MMRRSILLVAAVSLLLAVSSGAYAQDDPPPPMDCFCENEGMAGIDKAYLVSGVVLAGIEFALIAHNHSRLSAGSPSGPGAMGGMMFGLLGMGVGTAITWSDETSVKVAGVACAVSGAVSFVYGLKSSEAINRGREESRDQGLRLEPVILGRRGGLEPGVFVSMRF